MSIFSTAKASLAARKLAEEQLYEMAVEEIVANNIRQGLWAKALIESNGNETAARAKYIKLRVESLKAEADLQEYVAENFEKERREREREEAEAERRAAARKEKSDFKPTGPNIDDEGFSDSDAWMLYVAFLVIMLFLAAAV